MPSKNKLTKARRRVLGNLADEPKLLVGPEKTTACWLWVHGLAKYYGYNHYSITPAGRAALEPSHDE